MNKEQTIELAKQAGWTELGADLWGATHDGAMSTYALQRFAALVRADTALEAEPTPVQECGYDETTGTCTRNPCCAVEPAVGPVLLQLMRLLSALESWDFSNGQRMPDYLLEGLGRSVERLEEVLLERQAK